VRRDFERYEFYASSALQNFAVGSLTSTSHRQDALRDAAHFAARRSCRTVMPLVERLAD